MDRAWDAGITWFDTGDAYGGGTSERWIGEWMRARGERPKLTTKVFHSTTGTPGDEGLAPDRIRRQIRASLERLGVESVDFYLAHAQDPAVPLARDGRMLRIAARPGPDRRVGPQQPRPRRDSRHGARARAELLLAARSRRRGGRAAALPRARDPVRPVRAARGRLADGQVQTRRGVPRRLADDAASGWICALQRRAGVRRPGRTGRRGRSPRRVDGGARVRVGAPPAATAPCAGRTAPSISIR